ncbi:hypothetical protein NX059_011632 [Plenodomus lindquistii]|nr:hypothetical protein NX059_011632 [Plenodomus lindquistii]
MRDGQHAVWVDAACAPLVRERFESALLNSPQQSSCEPGSNLTAPSGTIQDDMRSRLHYIAAPTLAHLLALFIPSPASFPPRNTSVVIVDSLATLVDNAYPRNSDDRQAKVKTEQSRWAAGRRFAIINDLISTFTRFAATHDIALLITSQTITRMRGSSRAVLVPAMSGMEWENGISTRLVLFRDWMRTENSNDKAEAARLQRARFVGLTKANGVSLAEEGGVGTVVAFTIEHSGLQDLNIPADNITAPVVTFTHARPPKRPAAEIDQDAGEEPNSDELYGWIEDDEVAAEGLLINDTSVIDNISTAGTRLEVVTEGRSKKVARTTTV